MADLLTDHMLPVRFAVAGGCQIGVIHFASTLGNMTAACPDLSQPKPAIVSVGCVAGAHLTLAIGKMAHQGMRQLALGERVKQP